MDPDKSAMFGKFHLEPPPAAQQSVQDASSRPRGLSSSSSSLAGGRFGQSLGGHRSQSATGGASSNAASSARPPQAHACLECRRRKSKCDGQRPCSRCRASGREELCVYVGQKKRIVPSQRTVDELARSLQQCRQVLGVLFPGADEASLQHLGRDGLVRLASASASASVAAATGGCDDGGGAAHQQQHPFKTSVVALPSARMAPALPSEHNEVLERMACDEEHSEYDEQEPDYVSSDVNALDLTRTGTASYVGSSSVSAALRVIATLCPGVVKQPSLYAPSTATSGSTPSQEHDITAHANIPIPRSDETNFINAYFEHVHPTLPMINEARFRHDYTTGLKQNPSWLGLVNMVLCMGSIAGQTAQHQTHLTYYQRARRYLTFDSLGSGRLETIQALALMGGMYFHYSNQPNMALSTMGATVRMCYALGLHRLQSQPAEDHAQQRRKPAEPDDKLRTWWCVVCMDVWGSTTVGRPMSDYFGPSTLSTRFSLDPRIYDTPHGYPILLAADSRFCEISAQIQERLTIASCLSPAEIDAFDSELEAFWETEVPDVLKVSGQGRDHQTSAAFVPHAILKWRYLNARYLLRRPVLLSAALLRRSPGELVQKDQRSIRLCRQFAQQTIYDIALEWRRNHFCGWHAAWNLFQATFVPLVSLYYEPNNEEACKEWRRQVSLSLELFTELDTWSLGGKRTKQVLSELFEFSSRLGAMSDQDSEMAAFRENIISWDRQQSDMQHIWADNVLDAPHVD